MVLGIEDKVSSLLFNGLHKTQTIQTSEDIRAIFIKIGIGAEEHDVTWNSVMVKYLVLQQDKAVVDLQLIGVPAIFVNERYMIKQTAICRLKIAISNSSLIL